MLPQRGRNVHLLYSMLSNQKGTPVRLMQSRFLKELPDSRYELLNVHSSFGVWRGYNIRNQYGEILTEVDTVEDLISQLVYLALRAWSKAGHANNAQS